MKNMKNQMKKKKKSGCILLFLFGILLCHSCTDNDNSNQEYDPGKSVLLSSFHPETGGLGTKMIIEGQNFGSDTSVVKVYFNKKKATIIRAQGHRLYLFVPRLPGDTCVISVKVGEDSTAFDKTFDYITRFNVTTIAGQPGVSEYEVGTTLDKAKLGDVNCLAIDSKNNIFITNNTGQVTMVNQESNRVSFLMQARYGLTAPTIGENDVLYVPTLYGNEYYELSPETDWTPKFKLILQPSDPNKTFRLDQKHSLAYHKSGYIYTAAKNNDGIGQLIKFNPRTGIGEKVANLQVTYSNAYLHFDPLDSNILYMVHAERHCIFRYHLDTGEQELFAGVLGVPGWRDGRLKEAEFYWPAQITLGPDGHFYVADEGTHTIRQITPDGYVNTVVGAGQKGYKDGNPEEAMFDNPRGVALDADGNIYVADRVNKCLRKLTME